jgi:MFS superfamily sulfate permease-like transporter
MLRWAEVLLFLAPFVVFLLWWRISLGGGPSRIALAATLVGLVVFGAVLAWFGIDRSMGRHSTYVPARVEDGRIVPGHAMPQ